jgi:hypothetical protein
VNTLNKICLLFLFIFSNSIHLHSRIDFEAPIHGYFKKTPKDIFSGLKVLIDSGAYCNKRFSDHLSMLSYLLEELKISRKSQILVFSNTSLQLSKIGPRTPRAIFFSDDLYFGYVPNGQIELIGIDPEIGAIPYIFRLPQYHDEKFPPIHRSHRCMRCHASEKTEFIPGLVLESVIPIDGGGTLDVLNREKPGHSLPYDLRFGGWFIDDAENFGINWANKVGLIRNGNTEKRNLPPTNFSKIHLNRHSDPIAHIVLEHQIGLVNLCIKIQYQIRESNSLSIDNQKLLNTNLTNELLDYITFKNEPKLPNPIVVSSSPFAMEFQKQMIAPGSTDILRQFDLKTKLFKYPCSYMINNRLISWLPEQIKDEFYAKLINILKLDSSIWNENSHLGKPDRLSLHQFLTQFNKDYRKQKRHP